MKKQSKMKTVTRNAHARTSSRAKPKASEKSAAPTILVAEGTGDTCQEAFDSTKAARDALPISELLPRRLDVASAVSTVLGAYPALHAFRTQIAALPSFDVEAFDAIPTYANATFHALALYASTPDSAVAPEARSGLYTEALSRRELMNSDLKALIKRALLDAKVLDDVTNLPGYKNVASDVMTLSTVAQQHWSSISTKTALTETEIEQARDIAARLITVSNTREKSDSATASGVTLQRALTLLVNAYDEARAALAFVRRKEGDAVTIAPSIYSQRTGRRKADTSDPVTPPPPAVAPAAPAAPATGATASDEPTTSVVPATPSSDVMLSDKSTKVA